MIDQIRPLHPLAQSLQRDDPGAFDAPMDRQEAWSQRLISLLNRATFYPELPVIVCGRAIDLQQARGEHLGNVATGAEARELAAGHFSFGDEQPERIVITLMNTEEPFFGALDRQVYDDTYDLAAAQPGGVGPVP